MQHEALPVALSPYTLPLRHVLLPRLTALPRRAVRAVAMATAAAIQISVAGCSGAAEASEKGLADAALARDLVLAGGAAGGQAGEVVALSEFESATFTSLAVDASGGIHAAWLDRRPGGSGPRLFHRASRDGGRSWTALEDLSGGQPAGFTGIPQLVTDGAGRVYALWKVINPGGTLVLDEEKPGLPALGTLVYRVLEGGRWSGVQSLGNAQGVLAWYAAGDTRGRVHVVWSENPGEFSAFTTPSSARVVRQATLEGATPGTARDIVRGTGDRGYWGLSGYVTAQGTPRWVAITIDAASRSSTLVQWTGTEERALLDFATLHRAYDEQSLPRLVADEAGQEHLVLYNGVRDNPGVLDLTPGQRAPQGVVYQPRRGGSSTIRDFQISRGPSGQLIATVQVAGEGDGKLTDLFVSTLSGGRWSAPVQLTNNARRGTETGVLDAAGRSLGSAKAWYAVHASVAYDQAGAPAVLMTNRETSASLDVRAGGSVSALGRSKAFFLRPLGLTSSPVASRRPASAGGGAPPGKYNCYAYGARLPMPWEPGYGDAARAPVSTTKYLMNLTIVDAANYQYLDRGRGTYRLESKTGMITWLSGPFAGSGIRAAFARRGDARPVIYLDLDGTRAYCIGPQG